MAQTAEKLIDAKQAIAAAFDHFRTFYDGRNLRHVLLEGVRYDDFEKVWEITIGFDLGRERRSSGQLSFFDGKSEPIREYRKVKVRASDGDFVEMDHE